MPSPIFTPANWYWVVGGSTTQVFSSAAGDFVSVSDLTYVAWLATQNGSKPDGTPLFNKPTNIDTEANLGAVVAGYLLRPTAANVLDGYKDKLAGDIVVQVIFKILFQHENRMRALERFAGLNGSPPDLTAGQAKAAVKALM
jgi:hypothetical protein